MTVMQADLVLALYVVFSIVAAVVLVRVIPRRAAQQRRGKEDV